MGSLGLFGEGKNEDTDASIPQWLKEMPWDIDVNITWDEVIACQLRELNDRLAELNKNLEAIIKKLDKLVEATYSISDTLAVLPIGDGR